MESPEHQHERRSAPGESAEAAALRAYLSTDKAKCPNCGYDVHGCDATVCPECAGPLTLQLRGRTSMVPYWAFSLLVNGWLFLWGLGGTLTTAIRVWRYHVGASRLRAAALNTAQTNIPQLGRGSSTGPVGSGGGAGVSLLESIRTFFVAQDLVDQWAAMLFVMSFVVGAIGLVMTPRARNIPGRWCAWLIWASALVFVATMIHYVARYWTFLMRSI